METELRILHLIDSLRPGGAEMLAVNIFNGLNERGVHTWLVSTREEGILKEKIRYPDKYLFLQKGKTLDRKAYQRLNRFIRKNNIQLIHAHSTSFFTAMIMKWLNPKLKIIWHDHYGQSEMLDKRNIWPYKIASLFFDGIIVVNMKLEDWAKRYLYTKRVQFLNNFPVLENSGEIPQIKGVKGKRIFKVAGFRPQKDHPTLLRAFKRVMEKHPGATLHLIGPTYGDAYEREVRRLINRLGLQKSVFVHGAQKNIGDWLAGADIGVLSSQSEGLPVSLLEYGLAGLPVTATAVGEIPAVLGNGTYGKIVPPGDAEALAKAICYLLDHPDEAKTMGMAFRRHVESRYSEEAFMEKLIQLYKEVPVK